MRRRLMLPADMNSEKILGVMRTLELLLIWNIILGCARAEGTNTSRTSCVTPQCHCSIGLDDHVTAECKVNQLKDVTQFIRSPQNITSLSLSAQGLYTVPPGCLMKFINLVNLTLANNNIAVIAQNAFRGLRRLRFINLRHNQIRWWEGNLTRELISLESIDMTGNPAWLPTGNILELRTLKEIQGLTWSDVCVDCEVTRNESTAQLYRRGSYGVYRKWYCRGVEYTVRKATQTFGRYDFVPKCFDTNEKCYTSEVKATPSHRCWVTDNRILNVEYAIGIAVILFNVVVVTVTMTSPLKRNVAMLLVANLAISDFIVGLYSISITAARQSTSYPVYMTLMNSLCNILGFMWTLGQFATIQTSLLLTAERYTTIIFAMKPHLKFTPRTVLMCVGVSWLVAICAAVLPLIGVGSYITNTYCVPVQPSKGVPYSYAFSVGVALIGILLYICTIPLYIHIFLFVRKTSHQAGVKRDAKIACRIALLVMSNMVFFLTPVIICLLWLLTDIFKRNISVGARNVLVGVFPTFCLSFNSFLNPLLYAFRNNRFRLIIKQKLKRFFFSSSFVADISMKSRTESRTN